MVKSLALEQKEDWQSRGLFAGVCIALLSLTQLGCLTNAAPSPGRLQERGTLRLAVTTSTRDSGLLGEIIPPFEEQYGIRVDVLAVGTGAALKLGEQGDVDAILCHAPQNEKQFMEAGHGVRRESVMQNRFLILGPESDPAEIRDKPPVDAFQQIATGKHTFVSRGDKSGTHQREEQLWTQVESPSPRWSKYMETGQGMGRTLVIADEKQGYTICDKGTYLNFCDKVSLVPLVNQGDSLQNPYAAIAVAPEKNSAINGPAANTFLDYLIDTETQQRIADFSIQGETMFEPLRLEPAQH